MANWSKCDRVNNRSCTQLLRSWETSERHMNLVSTCLQPWKVEILCEFRKRQGRTNLRSINRKCRSPDLRKKLLEASERSHFKRCERLQDQWKLKKVKRDRLKMIREAKACMRDYNKQDSEKKRKLLLMRFKKATSHETQNVKPNQLPVKSAKKAGQLTQFWGTKIKDKTKGGNVLYVSEDDDIAFAIQSGMGYARAPTVEIELKIESRAEARRTCKPGHYWTSTGANPLCQPFRYGPKLLGTSGSL